MIYVLIKNIRIKGANMMQTPTILSPIPLFASCMFSRMLSARLNSALEGVGVVFHQAWPDVEYFPDAGRLKPLLINKRGATAFTIAGETNGGDYAGSGATPNGMSYQPGATATVEMSLLLKFEDGFSKDYLDTLLKNAKIGGGKVERIGHIEVFEGLLADAIKKLPSGYWVTDAADVVQKRLEAGESIIESVLNRATPTILSADGEDDQLNFESGWYVPATVGYSPITDFSIKNGARDNLTHAYAEPLVGLVRLMSLSKIKQQENPPTLWKHRWIEDGNVSAFHIYQ